MGGDKTVQGITVPRGIKQMLMIQTKKNRDGTDLSAKEKLIAYQNIAQKRLQKCNWANFFNTRAEATTQQFYHHLVNMKSLFVDERAQASLMNFLNLIVLECQDPLIGQVDRPMTSAREQEPLAV